MNGWLSTASRRYVTGDGGESWTLDNNGGGYDFQVSTDDAILCATYLSGNNGTISRSTDQGQTWRQLGYNCFAYRAGAVTPDGNFFWAGGDGFLVRHDLKALIEAANGTGIPSIRYTSLRAYPNPTAGRFTVDLPVTGSTTQLEVLDLGGRLVRREVIAAGTERQTLDLADAAPGVYLIRWLAGAQAGRTRVVVR
ncbi:MAG: T9SS type A sorting domain-containing protein [Bacteroidota bacterium]